jgi:hypothetical protein
VGRRIRPERHNPHSIATLRIAIARQLLEAVASLSLLRSQRDQLIFSIHVYFRDAGLWAGMVGRCVPCAFEQLHSADTYICAHK